VFSPKGFGVELVTEQAAKAFVLDRHYSGTFPAARLSYGLIDGRGEAPELAGVAVLSVPASKAVLTNALPGLEAYTESIELGRFILSQEVAFNGESWFLAEMMRQATVTGIRGIVSFSDPMPRADRDGNEYMPGHIGQIYQATNATYTGRGTERTLIILPDGSVFSARAAQKIRSQDQGHEYAERVLAGFGARPMRAGENPAAWLAEALDAAKARRVRHRGNHRYVFALGATPGARRAVRKGIGMPGQPYPRKVALAA
jgi:hypothetical protein